MDERQTQSVLGTVRGTLHAFVAFDWGDEIYLGRAQPLIAAPLDPAPRRKRTPSSITYRPKPLRFSLGNVKVPLPVIGEVAVPAEATLFDFAAASVALHIPLELSQTQLAELAAGLAAPEEICRAAELALRPYFEKLLPAIDKPRWSDLSEEYFVFEFSPQALEVEPLLQHHGAWLAGLLRVQAEPLCDEEVHEALRQQIRYGQRDLFVADWAAGVLIDSDCEDTLQTVEFANLQLLEFRDLDTKLDDQLAATYDVIQALSRKRWLFWRAYSAQLQALGELKMDANQVFDRTQNALKLSGDMYLARLYRLMAAKFHLDVWQQSIQRSLDVIGDAYQVLSDQASARRAEMLEIAIVLLIVFEIVIGWYRH